MPDPSYGLPAKRTPDTHIGKMERSAKQQQKYWIDLIIKNGKSRPGCCVCGDQKADNDMIYLVTDDIYVCGRFCTKRIRHD